MYDNVLMRSYSPKLEGRGFKDAPRARHGLLRGVVFGLLALTFMPLESIAAESDQIPGNVQAEIRDYLNAKKRTYKAFAIRKPTKSGQSWRYASVYDKHSPDQAVDIVRGECSSFLTGEFCDIYAVGDTIVMGMDENDLQSVITRYTADSGYIHPASRIPDFMKSTPVAKFGSSSGDTKTALKGRDAFVSALSDYIGQTSKTFKAFAARAPGKAGDPWIFKAVYSKFSAKDAVDAAVNACSSNPEELNCKIFAIGNSIVEGLSDWDAETITTRYESDSAYVDPRSKPLSSFASTKPDQAEKKAATSTAQPTTASKSPTSPKVLEETKKANTAKLDKAYAALEVGFSEQAVNLFRAAAKDYGPLDNNLFRTFKTITYINPEYSEKQKPPLTTLGQFALIAAGHGDKSKTTLPLYYGQKNTVQTVASTARFQDAPLEVGDVVISIDDIEPGVKRANWKKYLATVAPNTSVKVIFERGGEVFYTMAVTGTGYQDSQGGVVYFNLFEYGILAYHAGHPAIASKAARRLQTLVDEAHIDARLGKPFIAILEALVMAPSRGVDAALGHILDAGGLVLEKSDGSSFNLPANYVDWYAPALWPLYQDRRKLAFLIGKNEAEIAKPRLQAPPLQPFPDLAGNIIQPAGAAAAPKLIAPPPAPTPKLAVPSVPKLVAPQPTTAPSATKRKATVLE